MLPLAIDLEIARTTPEQRLLAYLIVAALAVVVIFLTYRSHYTGLPEDLKSSKAAYTGARASTDLTSVYLDISDGLDELAVRDAVQTALDGDADPDATVRGAAGSVRGALYETWAPWIERIPRSARRVASLALVVTVLGAVAVSTDLLIRALSASTPGVRPTRYAELALSESLAVLAEAGAVLQTTPGLNLLWALVVVVVITGGAWLYSHWWVSAAVLALSAVGLAVLEGGVPGRDRHGLSRELPLRVLRASAVLTASAWAIVLVAIGAGREVGGPPVGVLYGLYALGGVAIVGVVGLAWLVVQRRRWFVDGPRAFWQAPGSVKAYSLTRTCALATAAVVGPLLPVYAAVAALRLPRLWGALVAADAPIQAVVSLVTIAIAGVLAYQARAAWGDVGAALKITTAKGSVRAAVAARGVPVAVVAVTYALVAGLTKSIPIGLVAAIGAGLAAREVVAVLTKARYRAQGFSSSRSGARRLVIEGARLDPDDARAAWYVRLNGERELLWPDRDELATAAVAVADDLEAGGDQAAKPEPEWHATFAFGDGVSDPEETQQKLVERARRRVFHELRENSRRVPESHLEAELADLPSPLDTVDADTGVVGVEWRRGNIQFSPSGDYVELRRDPYV